MIKQQKKSKKTYQYDFLKSNTTTQLSFKPMKFNRRHVYKLICTLYWINEFKDFS